MTEHTHRSPLVHLPVAGLAAIHRALAEGRSPAEAAQLARRIGFETGAAFHAALEDWLAERETGAASLDALPQHTFWDHLSHFFAEMGWGALDFEPLHPGVISLSGTRWAEADGAPRAHLPTCHLTTGLLADLLSRVAGTDLAVMEVECQSRGDGRCRFLAGSPEAMGAVYERLREGGSYAEALQQLA